MFIRFLAHLGICWHDWWQVEVPFEQCFRCGKKRIFR